jgi:hypothetical protein
MCEALTPLPVYASMVQCLDRNTTLPLHVLNCAVMCNL